MTPVAIYKITNKVNGKFYIGQSVNPTRRYIEHSNKNFKNSLVSKAIAKYGKENFEMDILVWCEGKDYANFVEINLIESYGAIKNGYNVFPGGEGFPGGKEHPHFGKNFSEDHKQALSEVKLGKIPNHTPKEKLSEMLLKANEVRRRAVLCTKDGVTLRFSSIVEASEHTGLERGSIMGLAKKGIIGRKGWSVVYEDEFENKKNETPIDWKKKASNNKKTLYITPNDVMKERSKLAAAVNQKKVCVHTEHETFYFDSITEAAVGMGICKASVSNYLKGKSVNKKGWKFSQVVGTSNA
jgi:hypothetical protein